MKKIFLAGLVFLLILSTVSAAALWDPLRPVSEAAAQFDAVTKVLVFAFSAAILAIALLAYRKTRSRRFLLIAFAFLLFAGKWFLKIMDLFVSPGLFLPDSSENVFELAILVLLFVALFYKGK